jgi:hypothetical protein
VNSAWAERRIRRQTAASRPRPRGVWIATVVGVLAVLVLAFGAFLPLVGFLAGITGTTAGLVPFPFVRVTLVTLLGAVVVLAFLLLAATRRHTTTSWTAVVLALLVTVGVTVFPLVVVAIGSADRAGDVWPVVSGLWSRFVG